VRRVTAHSTTVAATAPTVLTAGAGASRLVGELLAGGLRVIAVDIAAAALDALSRELSRQDPDAAPHLDRLQLLVGDVRTLRIDDPVDVWHDRAVFHFFVDDDDRRAYAEAASASVRPGGHLVIATFAPDGPTSCSGLPVMRHDAASLASSFERGFQLLDSFEADHVTPWASTQRFTHAVFRRT
jgi:SAM-dependent methyltransferase